MRLKEILERDVGSRTAVRRKASGSSQSVASHKIFVPMIAIWGALLVGLSLLVLPQVLVARITMIAGMNMAVSLAQPVIASIGAALGGALGFIIAASIKERVMRKQDNVSIVSKVSADRIRPINPAADLGSETLDSPIDKMPFAPEEQEGEFVEVGNDASDELNQKQKERKDQPTLGELAKRGYEIEEPKEPCDDGVEPGFTRKHFKSALIETCEVATCEASSADKADMEPTPPKPVSLKPKAQSSSQDPEPAPIGRAGSNGSWSLTQFNPNNQQATKAPREKPRELDLSEFAELPGRNAVWVEEGQVRDQEQDARSDGSVSALEKLRQKHPEELSLVEMVERFAGALHEHQQAERAQQAANVNRGRDVALAEALKALTLFTEQGFDQPRAANTQSPASDLNETERELRQALSKLQSLRGAA